MRVSLKNKAARFLIIIGLTGFWQYAAAGEDYGVFVKDAQLHRSGENYALDADIDFKLSDRAKDALKNGVPLYWTYQFVLNEERGLMWNKTVAEKKIRYRIQHHALLNTYKVRNENSGNTVSEASMEAALEHLSSIRNLPVFTASIIGADNDYVASLKISFDRDALPLPLRPVAYMHPQWYLSSDSYTWPLVK